MPPFGIKKIFDDYILSWFKDRELDKVDIIPDNFKLYPVALRGKFDWGIALDYYKKENSPHRTPIGECFYRFKYHDDKNCGAALEELLDKWLNENSIMFDADYSTCVPVTLKSRPVWPMKYILNQIDNHLIGQLIPDLLIRKKVTSQTKDVSDYEEKRAMLKGMYRINENYDITDRTILLFDDIRNTGLTLNECALALKDAGARQVLVITLVTTQRR